MSLRSVVLSNIVLNLVLGVATFALNHGTLGFLFYAIIDVESKICFQKTKKKKNKELQCRAKIENAM